MTNISNDNVNDNDNINVCVLMCINIISVNDINDSNVCNDIIIIISNEMILLIAM